MVMNREVFSRQVHLKALKRVKGHNPPQSLLFPNSVEETHAPNPYSLLHTNSSIIVSPLPEFFPCVATTNLLPSQQGVLLLHD